MPNRLTIEISGHQGSGKSALLALVADALGRRGVVVVPDSVMVRRPYQVKAELAREDIISPRAATDLLAKLKGIMNLTTVIGRKD